jgi:hypothetical protein
MRAGEIREVKPVVGKSEGKKALGRPTCKWKDNIIIDVHEILFEDME